MSYIEILTSGNSAVTSEEQWNNTIHKEYLGQMFWKPLMGTKDNSVILVNEQLTKSPGDAVTFRLRGQLVGGHVTGNNKGIGNEGSVSFYQQRVTIDNDRQIEKFEDVPMTNKRVGFDVLMAGKDALTEKQSFQLDDDITSALTTIGSERVRGRYLYGASDSNWSSTHTSALQNVDNTADKLSSSMISVAKRKALVPVNATMKIRPTKIQVAANKWEEWFILVAHPYAIRDLVDNDATYRNQQMMLPPRSDTKSPLFSGSSFKGAHNGVLIHEFDRLPLLSSTIQCGHNLLLGAKAGLVGWGQRSKFAEEYEDLGHDYICEVHEIRGQAKAVFNLSTPEDFGLVNVISAAVAD